jgi:hypothetical protein
MWAVLVGIILAGMFGILPQPTQDYYLVCVAAVAVGVAAVVYRLSWTHALLPHEHDTICDITGATESHFLSYVTGHEKKVLLHDHAGRGTASKGLMGSQGVPCFPAEDLRPRNKQAVEFPKEVRSYREDDHGEMSFRRTPMPGGPHRPTQNMLRILKGLGRIMRRTR